MQLVTIVLNKVDCLEGLLAELVAKGIRGGTIIDSTGMARAMGEENELRFLGSLRQLLDPDREESKMVLLVVEDEQIKVISEIVNKVVGDLSQPDSGIIFAVPVSYTEGLGKDK